MPQTENSGQVFLPGGVQHNSKFEIWPLHYFLHGQFLLISLFSCLILSGMVLQVDRRLKIGQKMKNIGDLNLRVDRN